MHDLRYASHNYILSNLIRIFDKLWYGKVRKLSVINDSISDLYFYHKVLKYKITSWIPVCIPCTQSLNIAVKVIMLDLWCAYLFWPPSPVACLHSTLFFFNIIEDGCILHIEELPFLAYSSMSCWKYKDACHQHCRQDEEQSQHPKDFLMQPLCIQISRPPTLARYDSVVPICLLVFHYIIAFYAVLLKILLTITRVKVPNRWK